VALAACAQGGPGRGQEIFGRTTKQTREPRKRWLIRTPRWAARVPPAERTSPPGAPRSAGR
jgi:hypothetical protein